MKQNESELAATKGLWKLCFNDFEAFIDLYFRLKYKDELNMSVYDNGVMISALQMIPYSMTFCNKVIPTSYISGACTHPDYRSQGVMKQLLVETFARKYKDNILLSTLIPAEKWLFDYYSKFGYAYAFDYSIEQVNISLLQVSQSYQITPYTSCQLDVYSYLNRKMMERPCCVQHTMDDFEVIVGDLQLSKGELFVARLQMDIIGLAFCTPDEGIIYVKELFAESQEIEDSLLKEASVRMGIDRINRITFPSPTDRRRLGMARIINAEKLLGIYAAEHPEVTVSLSVSDEFIPENNGRYRLESGTCKRIFDTKEIVFHLNIEQLTQFLLDYYAQNHPNQLHFFDSQQPYMSLMLD